VNLSRPTKPAGIRPKHLGDGLEPAESKRWRTAREFSVKGGAPFSRRVPRASWPRRARFTAIVMDSWRERRKGTLRGLDFCKLGKIQKMLAVWERDRIFVAARGGASPRPSSGGLPATRIIGVGCRDSLLVALPPRGSSLARAPVTRGQQGEGQEQRHGGSCCSAEERFAAWVDA
jgi:hypothetical protein